VILAIIFVVIAIKYVVKFGLCRKIRRNIATFHLNIYSNLCSLENKSIILGVFWW
jgi:hypothetical protein